ncbi:MAG: methylated-DNA--[protein]-cysteine S-methyltransferase [Ferruginibacter sp.]
MVETVLYKSPVGTLRIVAYEDAISEASFVNKEVLDEEQPDAALFETTDPLLKKCMLQLDDYFSGKNLQFNLVLGQPGTDFQQKVWAELCKIKEGSTISYHELSRRLGNVKAIRAAGTANGKNNIAIIVPCHRVIGSNGTLVGYAGGIWRKKWLLEHEAKHCNGLQTLF